MPDETVQTQSSEAAPAASTSPSTSAISQGIGLCAGIVSVSFFLPWINIIGLKPSGFDFVQKSGSASILLWAIPFFGIVALIAAMAKSSGVRTAGQLAGVVPLFVLGYGFYDSGVDLLKVLDLGAY